MIKKVKIEKVFIGDEKEITASKGKNKGKKFKLCDVSIKIEGEEKWIKGGIFASEKHTAKENADYFKTQNSDKSILVDIEEESWEKDGKSGTNLKFKLPSKEAKLKFLEEQF